LRTAALLDMVAKVVGAPVSAADGSD